MRRSLKRGQSPGIAEGRHDGEATELIKFLIEGGADSSRLLELCYWTREPGIIELIRAYLDLPERTQRTLSTFLLNGRPQSIAGSFDQQGRLVLARVPASEQAAAEPAEKQRQALGT